MTGKLRYKVALASSFEGVVNNGATECAIVSFNAYNNMPEGQGKFFDRTVETEEFPSIRNHKYINAFLAMRPDVTIAEDYLTVMQVLENSSDEAIDRMLNNPEDEEAFRPLRDTFEHFKATTPELRSRFGSRENLPSGEKSAFYKERERMKIRDVASWMGTQEPYKDSIEQFRYLIRTQERVDNAVTAFDAVNTGFVPWFATTKDAQSTYLLCKIYSQTSRMKPGDIGKDGNKVCVISTDRIIGREQWPKEDDKLQLRVNQLNHIAEKEGIRNFDVWRLEDRYDPKEQSFLREHGFPTQFVVPGYMYKFDLAKAENNPNVTILEKKNFGPRLYAFAERCGMTI